MKNLTKNDDWYRIVAKSEDEADVMIYDVVGWDTTADRFVKDLKAVKAKTINLHLNSPGGAVFEGFAIYNALKQHDAKVITHIDGLAASIASIIAIAGDEVRIARNAYMMIHNPWNICLGDGAEMRKNADLLDKLAGTLAQTYADKTGGDADDMTTMMNEETWFTADEAKAIGLVDVISDAEEPEKQETRRAMKAAAFVRNFDRVPEALRARLDLKPANAFSEGHPLPARAGSASTATTETTPMNAEAFAKYAAENAEAAEVKNLIAKGHKAGHADGYADARKDLASLVAAAPARIEDAVKAFDKGQDLDTFKAIADAADAEKSKADAVIAAKDAEIARLTAEAEQAKALVGTQAAVGTGATQTTAAIAEGDHKAAAAAEWDTDPEVRKGFSSKDNYVAYRESVLAGTHRDYTREPRQKS
jgi:ATP-dependent Clp endopeptidase proteolytic subunit ClpP